MTSSAHELGHKSERLSQSRGVAKSKSATDVTSRDFPPPTAQLVSVSLLYSETS